MGSIDQPSSLGRLYIAGSTGGHSIAPAAHNYISEHLKKGWTMEFLKKPTPEEIMEVFRLPDFKGGVVTMPHKKTIMQYLDEVDSLAYSIGACNVVTATPEGRFHGTNTDWFGIMDALLTVYPQHEGVAMVYGAGGASRAAIYALFIKLGYRDIYVINRDDDEVAELKKDMENLNGLIRPKLTHVETTSQAKNLPAPTCIVSTVPDIDANTCVELEVKNILGEFLSRASTEKRVLLDMCYHPRTTSNILLAKQNGWATVEGIEVVGRQLKLQWKLWTGEEIPAECEKQAMAILERCAAADPNVTPKGSQPSIYPPFT